MALSMAVHALRYHKVVRGQYPRIPAHYSRALSLGACPIQAGWREVLINHSEAAVRAQQPVLINIAAMKVVGVPPFLLGVALHRTPGDSSTPTSRCKPGRARIRYATYGPLPPSKHSNSFYALNTQATMCHLPLRFCRQQRWAAFPK